MFTDHENDAEWLDGCIREAKQLQAALPTCHKLRNELGALQMLKDLLGEGLPLNRETAENCLARMRAAIGHGEGSIAPSADRPS